LILFFFAGQAVAIDEEILGAEQAHTFRAAGLDGVHVTRLLNVSRQGDAPAVERDRKLGKNFVKLLVEGRSLAGELAVFKSAWSVGLTMMTPL